MKSGAPLLVGRHHHGESERPSGGPVVMSCAGGQGGSADWLLDKQRAPSACLLTCNPPLASPQLQVALPVESASGTCFLQLYIESILALGVSYFCACARLQAAGQYTGQAGAEAPLVIAAASLQQLVNAGAR